MRGVAESRRRRAAVAAAVSSAAIRWDSRSSRCACWRTSDSGWRKTWLPAARSSRARARSSWRRIAPRSRSAAAATAASKSALRPTTSSAAAEGVGARRSATKSAIVKSISCPTAEITGTREAWIARATDSSLKHHKSSMLPPPRPTMMTSGGSGSALSSSRAATISGAASAPWTRAGAIRMWRSAKRRRVTLSMSRMAAPVGEVTMPIRRGSIGSGRLRSCAKRPSASSRLFSASNWAIRSPRPARSIARTTTWYVPRCS